MEQLQVCLVSVAANAARTVLQKEAIHMTMHVHEVTADTFTCQYSVVPSGLAGHSC